ncbi:MAG: alpha/beta fold hydrolase [Phycisphaerae bacterium]|nr:alpha/beta fold hydrolase [Phycisphaerae bacterium]
MSDGYALQGRLWRATGRKPDCGILYLHGIQSHGGWFEWSASLLADSGNPVLLPDRRGSGLNQAARGDTPGRERWLADLDELSDWAEREFGVSQFAVVGVSWGGKPAVAWALKRSERVQRLLLIAPGLFPAVDVGLGGRLRVGVSLLTRPTRLLPIPLDDPALFTQNPMGQSFIASDALKLTHATARFFYESSRLDRMLLRAGEGSLRAQTTLVLAGRERIIRNARTEAWLERLAAGPLTVHTFPNASHTLEFESEPEPFGRLVEEWGEITVGEC